jgi:hypothetical protein
MKRVYVCAPSEIAGTCVEQSVKCGVAPIAPHFFIPFLSGDESEKRANEIARHYLWLCDELWVFGALQTEEMKKDISLCRNINIPIIDKEKGGKRYE